LGELGVVGLVLVVGSLAVPLAAMARARPSPLVSGATGAYAAFLVHAAVDWDWEMPAVTLAAVTCAGAVLVAARPAPDADPVALSTLGPPTRSGLVSLRKRSANSRQSLGGARIGCGSG